MTYYIRFEISLPTSCLDAFVGHLGVPIYAQLLHPTEATNAIRGCAHLYH